MKNYHNVLRSKGFAFNSIGSTTFHRVRQVLPQRMHRPDEIKYPLTWIHLIKHFNVKTLHFFFSCSSF